MEDSSVGELERLLEHLDREIVKSLRKHKPDDASLTVVLEKEESGNTVRARIQVEVIGPRKPLPPEEIAARILDDTIKALEEKMSDERSAETKKAVAKTE